jgi:hypothetical protein
MTLPSEPGEKPQFSDTEEEVYFLKQVTRFTRKKRLVPALLGGSKTEDIGLGVSIYLCKMKPDGSEKTEIKELWQNPRYPVDTQAQTTWMDVNGKTRRIVLSIVIGGEDITGIWTVNLDGSELKRILAPGIEEGGRATFGNPSWTPDGQWIVFGKDLRSPDGLRGGIGMCNAKGNNTSYLTTNVNDTTPRVSPDGKHIAYIHQINSASLLWLMDVDGKNKHSLLDPKGKLIGGTYPAWSPDGKKIYAISMGIVDAVSGQMILDREPILQGRQSTCGWAHWGRLGFVGFNVGGIKSTDSELREGKWIGSSKLLECSNPKESSWW